MKTDLVIIGGAEDKKGDSNVLKKVVQMAGADKANFAIITTATEKEIEVGIEYKDVFERLGVGSVEVVNIDNRDKANTDMYIKKISLANAIFFTGGDQLRITSILGGTKAYKALNDACERNVLMIGTSAGASVMSTTMIIGGESNDPARSCTLSMGPGLGFLDGAIIDQHFHQRGRIGRLLCSVASNPSMLGIGIDEDTAIRVYTDGHFSVFGTNAVTVLDGSTIVNTNVSELTPDEILAISNATIHILPTGFGYNIANREILVGGSV